MLRYADEIDRDREYLPQFSENSQVYFDYEGRLPEDDDAADHYRIPRRYINASF